METNKIIRTYMNKIKITFKNKENNNVITRTILCSLSMSQKEISSYFLTSISQKCDLTFSDAEICLCYFENQDFPLKSNYYIDQHWIDGEICLMLNKDTNEEVRIVISNNLKEQAIFSHLKNQNNLRYISTLEECWIKRIYYII